MWSGQQEGSQPFSTLAPQDRGQPRPITPQLADLIERPKRETRIVPAPRCYENWPCRRARTQPGSLPPYASGTRGVVVKTGAFTEYHSDGSIDRAPCRFGVLRR